MAEEGHEISQDSSHGHAHADLFCLKEFDDNNISITHFTLKQHVRKQTRKISQEKKARRNNFSAFSLLCLQILTIYFIFLILKPTKIYRTLDVFHLQLALETRYHFDKYIAKKDVERHIKRNVSILSYCDHKLYTYISTNKRELYNTKFHKMLCNDSQIVTLQTQRS